MARSDLAEQMICTLRLLDVNLGDERDVIAKLVGVGFRAGDIVVELDRVIEETRRRGLKRSWA